MTSLSETGGSQTLPTATHCRTSRPSSKKHTGSPVVCIPSQASADMSCMAPYRWGTPVPLSIVHQLTEDDVYEGYDMPRGAVVIPNLWYVLSESPHPVCSC